MARSPGATGTSKPSPVRASISETETRSLPGSQSSRTSSPSVRRWASSRRVTVAFMASLGSQGGASPPRRPACGPPGAAPNASGAGSRIRVGSLTRVSGFRDLGFARVDTDREARQGAPEGIVAEGKTPDEIEAIARALLDGGAGSVMVSRADADARAALLRAAPDGHEDARARLAWVARDVPAARGLVTIVSAGTSDAPVVTEARVRAELLGTEVVVHQDAGVAGLHRLPAPPGGPRPAGRGVR